MANRSSSDKQLTTPDKKTNKARPQENPPTPSPLFIRGVSFIYHQILDVYRSLPIRFKLGIIIVLIVMTVLGVFSVAMLHSQRTALIERMNQVCNVLIRNLAESVKGDLMLQNKDAVTEKVLRLKNTGIVGLEKAAILDRKGLVVAGFEVDSDAAEVKEARYYLNKSEFGVVELKKSYLYVNPISTTLDNKGIVLGVALVSFSKEIIWEPIAKASRIALTLAIVVIAFAIVGINLIVKRITNRIQVLSEGAREVGAGNLDVTLKVDSRDELGLLAVEFNNMLQHLREKLQMQKFVSKLTVEMIRDTVRADSQSEVATKREVTVLFSDVRSFSSVAEHLDPGEIVKLINIYFDLQTRIIESHHGVVDKFMGDQIMAIFQGSTMADNAMRAAVEIQRQILLVNHKRKEGGKKTLEMGVGINKGFAVMGNMGSPDRMDYTVIGDEVNVAARLCSAAKAGQIITSYEVAKQVSGSYPTSRLKSISVKGRSQSIDICEVDYGRDILI